MHATAEKLPQPLGRILIVDDEVVVRDSLNKWFIQEGYQTVSAENARDALVAVTRGTYDVALIDIKMPGMDGMELQRKLRNLDPNMALIIMTGFASVETAVAALKGGAYDYITKPVDPDELMHLVGRALEHRRTKEEVVRLRESLREVFPKTELIGKSHAMKRVMELVEMVAPTDATVLVTGESGTGKEIVARAIHAASPRRHMPMVVIHCGALSEGLLESELFGHEKGAFTGAQYRKKGKFEIADGGTVFLDEISDISLKTQTDLLRVLQEKEIVRVGGTQTLKIDFRCITASNRSLAQQIKEGLFRSDLYFRLNVFTIALPSLRERQEDIPLLADHFLQKYSAAMNRPKPGLSAEAVNLLLDYDWPGNVRELENAVERALVICKDDEISSASFPFQQEHPSIPSERSLKDVEQKHICRIVEESDWNLSLAARTLGIDRTTLYQKLKQYGMERSKQ
jgi:DNA-binding NtrC family response regulator